VLCLPPRPGIGPDGFLPSLGECSCAAVPHRTIEWPISPEHSSYLHCPRRCYVDGSSKSARGQEARIITKAARTTPASVSVARLIGSPSTISTPRRSFGIGCEREDRITTILRSVKVRVFTQLGKHDFCALVSVDKYDGPFSSIRFSEYPIDCPLRHSCQRDKSTVGITSLGALDRAGRQTQPAVNP
jgi:hypothetical protein